MAQTAQFVAARVPGLDAIYTSDLPRAVESAQIIASSLPAPVPVVPDPRLRPINIGPALTGVIITPQVAKSLQALHENPDQPAPGGESYHDFIRRYAPALQELIAQAQNKNVLAVVHHRNILALPYMLYGAEKPEMKGPPDPSGAVVVGKNQLHLLYESPQVRKVGERGFAKS